MDIKRAFWFTGCPGVIGIVVVWDSIDKRRKAYIGTAPGNNVEVDTRNIIMGGQPFTPANARELSELLNVKREKHGTQKSN